MSSPFIFISVQMMMSTASSIVLSSWRSISWFGYNRSRRPSFGRITSWRRKSAHTMTITPTGYSIIWYKLIKSRFTPSSNL
uniref:Putative secreted protein n=1 Tax=Panstrongylus lignarius TaxID=156445 RepID=A0A224Y3C1_9HEMI